MMPYCGRCQRRIVDGKEEACWFCCSDLCYECWDSVGHCGHEQAEAMNRASRMLNRDGRARLFDEFMRQQHGDTAPPVSV